ncbi:MAG: hypothetical protein JWM28_1434 [Chitinophagaceae bacterium]|nr:hypothetical protein [Chitinophagaceae bacterium]
METSLILSKHRVYFINKDQQILVTDQYLNEWEKKLGGKLPLDYRTFLLDFGVIGFEKAISTKIADESYYEEFVEIDLLFGFTKDVEYDLNVLTFDTYSGRIPDETIPIGQASNNDLFLLSFIGRNKGKVWVWDHEHRELTEEKLDKMKEDLRKSKIDINSFDIDSIIWHWERLPNAKLEKEVGFSSVFLVAETFKKFIEATTTK